mgnify:CR=1 FL=1
MQKKKEIERCDLFTALCKTDLDLVAVKEFRFHPKRMWRFDYAIPDEKIALEVEGGVWSQGRHTRPKWKWKPKIEDTEFIKQEKSTTKIRTKWKP